MPPVRFQMTQVSMVPKRDRRPRRVARAPSTLSRIHAPWDPRSRSRAAGRSSPGTDPGRRRGRVADELCRCGCPARRWRCRPAGRSCGPRRRSVSRWLVMPTAARSDGRDPGLARGATDHLAMRCQISIGSCSTQPGFGKICACSFWSIADDLAAAVEDHEPGAGRPLIEGADVRRSVPSGWLHHASSGLPRGRAAQQRIRPRAF